MAKGATSLSEVRENEWTQSILTSALGVALIVIGALLYYFFNFWMKETPYMLIAGQILMVFVMLGGVFIVGRVVYQNYLFKKKVEPTAIKVTCPYCDTDTEFLATPTEDYVCEHCSRSVHFDENGKMVPVRVIVCQACRKEHRVAINVRRYVCDNCNRPLAIAVKGGDAVTTTEGANEHALLQNYDVLLMAIDRRHENDMAFKLQNLLVINMKEARKLMITVSPSTPLKVAQDVPQRKAEAIRRSLQELGATATIRASASQPGTAARVR